MGRTNVMITVKINEFDFLESYLKEKIGLSFSYKLEVVNDNEDKKFMNVKISLENGVSCFRLGCILQNCPVDAFIEILN